MPVSTIQPSFSGGELAPALHARVDFDKYRIGLALARNVIIHAEGGASNRAGSEFIAVQHDESATARLVPFTYNDTDTYMLEIGHLYIQPIRDGGVVVYPAGHAQAGQDVVIATTYTSDQLDEIKLVQSADRIRLTHPAHPPRLLSRPSGHHTWTLSDMTFSPSIAAPTGLAAAGAGTDNKWVVVAVDADSGEESLPSAEAQGGALPQTLTWSAVSGAGRYHVYRWSNGLFGFVGTTETTTFKDETSLKTDLSDTPAKARNPFESGANPAAIAFLGQRLVMGGLPAKPDTFEFSRPAQWTNFTKSEPQQDDDALSYTLAAGRVNSIRHLVSLKALLVFTAGAVHQITGEKAPAAVAPGATNAALVAGIGSSHLPPIVINRNVLFVEARRGQVYELQPVIESDEPAPVDRGVLAKHLFRGRAIVSWAYASAPDSILWVVMSDGALLSFTYLPDHKVYAWARHDTDGAFERVATVPEGGEDAVYLTVRRDIDGTTRRFVERFHARDFDAIAEGWFLDCALRYQGAPTTTLSGLDHLEGKTVSVLADGNVHPPVTVTSGQITLNSAASTVLTGLGYVSDIETLGVDYQARSGTIQGRLKTIPAVTLLLDRSRGGMVGPNADKLKPVANYNKVWGGASEAVSGSLRLSMATGWDASGRVFIRQSDPLPLTVLAIVPETEHGT